MAQQDYQKLTPAQAKRLGYSPGAERYRLKGDQLRKGNTISRRQFDNMSGRYDAYGGRAKFERRVEMQPFNYFIRLLAREKGDESPTNIRRISARAQDPDVLLAYRAARAKKMRNRGWNSPTGYLAKFLVRVGKRQSDWGFDVGDTP